MAKKFFVDDLTVDQIIHLNPAELAKLDARDVSRALRTISLAANKRITRLKQYAKKTPQGYVQKGGGKQIAVDALNWVTNDGHTRTKFGVKRSETRNEMLKQIKIASKFMRMESSTVSGATQLRKRREKAVFGKTREQAARNAKTKKGKIAVFEKYAKMYKDTWSGYRRFLELMGRDPHGTYGDSEGNINTVANAVSDGRDPEEIAVSMFKDFIAEDEQLKEDYNNRFNPDEMFEMQDIWTKGNR